MVYGVWMLGVWMLVTKNVKLNIIKNHILSDDYMNILWNLILKDISI